MKLKTTTNQKVIEKVAAETRYKLIKYSYQVNKSVFAGEYTLYDRHTTSLDKKIAQFTEFGIIDILYNCFRRSIKYMLPQGIRKYSLPIKNFTVPQNIQSLVESSVGLKILLAEQLKIKLYIHLDNRNEPLGRVCIYIYFERLSFDDVLGKIRKQYALRS